MKIDLIDEYSRDDWTIYGLWLVELYDEVVELAAVVGVPKYLQATAKAAGGANPHVCDAWFNDSSDWGDLDQKQKEEALNLLAVNAAALLNEPGSDQVLQPGSDQVSGGRVDGNVEYRRNQ